MPDNFVKKRTTRGNATRTGGEMDSRTSDLSSESTEPNGGSVSRFWTCPEEN